MTAIRRFNMKKFVSLFLSMLLVTTVFSSISLAASYYGDGNIESGKIYFIRNAGTGWSMDVTGGSYDVNASIITYSHHGGDNQRWQINVEKLQGNHIIVSIISKKSNLVLTTKSGYISQQSYNGTKDQMFKLVPVGTTGKYKIMSMWGNALRSNNQNPGTKETLKSTSLQENDAFYWTFEATQDKKSHKSLLRHWAPDVYQDFNARGKQLWPYDYITAFDFDGDWKGNNNWENANSGSKVPYVYTSIQETRSHYFITYNFFHPRDVGGTGAIVDPIDSHENDLEGALFVIKKGGDYGSIEAVYTISHSGYETYTGNSINLVNGKVQLFVSSNGPYGEHGHSVHMYNSSKDNGGIKYVYDPVADDNNTLTEASWNPSQDNGYHEEKYGLKLLDELWDKRYDQGSNHPFSSYTSFSGDGSGVPLMGSNRCNPPWAWSDGLWISDPAFFADRQSYFQSMSHGYIFNKYFAYKIVVNKVQSKAYKDTPISWKKRADIFVRVMIDGGKYIDINDWKEPNVDNYVWKNFNFGTAAAEGSARYTENVDTIYVAKPRNTHVYFEVRDRDSDNDDSMGTIKKLVAPGEYITFEENTDWNEARINGAVYSRME